MTVFREGWRVFFPLGTLFAGVAIPVWLVWFQTGGPDWVEDPLRWHRHEMLFGYLWAALAGFLLTAVPNWTGRRALAGVPLAVLAMLWLCARLVMVLLPAGGWQTVLALGFPIAVAGFITREIVAGGNRRNLPVVGALWAMGAAQLLFLSGTEEIGQRLGFGLALMLIILIGGRVTPAFTFNWLRAQGRLREGEGKAPFTRLDMAAMGTSAAALAVWVLFADSLSALAVLPAVAAGLLAVRLARWQGTRVMGEPLMAALHFGYAWVAVSMAFIAFSMPGLVTVSQAFHAIGAGAIGAMTVIVMMRACLGHSGRKIEGNGADIAILAAIHLGAALRVAVPWLDDATWAYHGSGTLWALGMIGFVLRYGRIALAPRA
ncbi:MAG: short-chain dehydrogenase [Rhodobacterales bacterium]|nr:MAG: short-chain dehydrogenase [Rhodobacterales bacterium]